MVVATNREEEKTEKHANLLLLWLDSAWLRMPNHPNSPHLSRTRSLRKQEGIGPHSLFHSLCLGKTKQQVFKMSDIQSKVNQLTLKIEGELKTLVDEVERLKLRPLGRNMHKCVVGCYDKAGKNGRKEHLESCSQQCQIPYQTAGAATQNEIVEFQNRLNRSMGQCNDEVGGMVTPEISQDERKMKKLEESLFKCLQGAVEKSRQGLKPLRQRIESHLS